MVSISCAVVLLPFRPLLSVLAERGRATLLTERNGTSERESIFFSTLCHIFLFCSHVNTLCFPTGYDIILCISRMADDTSEFEEPCLSSVLLGWPASPVVD